MTILDILPSLRRPHTDRSDADHHHEAEFRYRARRCRKEFPDTKVVYAATAQFTTAVASWVAEEHLGVAVRSIGQLETALAGGVRPSRIVYRGVPDRLHGLRAAADAGVGRIVVGSPLEIAHLVGLVPARQDVLVRVTACSPAAEISRVTAESMLRLVGVHGDDVRRLVCAMADARRAHGLVLGELHLSGEPRTDLHDELDSGCGTERFPRPTVVVPMRSSSVTPGRHFRRFPAAE